ncbi:MAG: hypothetical protein Q8M07_20530 [Prosthecobacter sp.]|nr:hypothetical protein [Prosthecobacter sp.]
MECLGFAGLLKKCPVKFILLVEHGVNAPTMKEATQVHGAAHVLKGVR